jgi:hypothetical protein
MSGEALFQKGQHVYMRNGNNDNMIPVKITAVKKRSMENTVHGRQHKYNVKIIGTKTQKQNVPESSLQGAKMSNWEKDPEMYGGRGKGKTRKASRKVKRTTRRLRRH